MFWQKDNCVRILFLGKNSGSQKHRLDALTRLGHEVTLVTPEKALSGNAVLNKIHWMTGGVLVEKKVEAFVLAEVQGLTFDMTWVDAGRLVGPGLVTALKRRFGPVMNYNLDDPYGDRDGQAWRLYLKSVPVYDLVAVVRAENVTEAKARQAKKVRLVFRAADEVAHAPRPLTDADHVRWDTDVAFIGTWMPERGPFMAELIQHGVPLSIFGGRWEKAAEWPVIQKAWKGPALNDDENYPRAIQCAKICLGLLSKGNRDLHTQRSLEIPALGSLLCAERTPEHQQLYCEGEEAVFWSTPEECADVCRRLLADEPRRREIARRGQQRAQENGYFNEPTAARLIADLMDAEPL